MILPRVGGRVMAGWEDAGRVCVVVVGVEDIFSGGVNVEMGERVMVLREKMKEIEKSTLQSREWKGRRCLSEINRCGAYLS